MLIYKSFAIGLYLPHDLQARAFFYITVLLYENNEEQTTPKERLAIETELHSRGDC